MPLEIHTPPLERPPGPGIPGRHDAAIKRMDECLAQGKLEKAAEMIRRSEESDPDEAAALERHLKLPKTLDQIERAVCRAAKTTDRYRQDPVFGQIRSLGLPDSFYFRPNVRAAAASLAVKMVESSDVRNLLLHVEDSRLVESNSLDLIPEDAVSAGIARAAVADIEKAQKLSKLFGYGLDAVPKKFLLGAYYAGVSRIGGWDGGRLTEKFFEDFPQITEEDRESFEEQHMDPSAQVALRRRIAANGWNEEQFPYTEKTLRRECVGAVAMLFSQFTDERDSDDEYHDDVYHVLHDADYVRHVGDAREKALLLQTRFHLEDATVERAIIDGLARRSDTTVERVRMACNILGGRAGFEDRLGRACAPAIFGAIVLENYNGWGNLKNLDAELKKARDAFPYVTDSDIRGICKDAIPSAIASYDIHTLSNLQNFILNSGMDTIRWNELPAFRDHARNLLLRSNPEDFVKFMGVVDAPDSERAAIIDEVREQVRTSLFDFDNSDDYPSPPQLVSERITLFKFTRDELPGFPDYAKRILLKSDPGKFEELARSVQLPKEEASRIIADAREEMRGNFPTEYPRQSTCKLIQYFKLAWNELPWFESYAKDTLFNFNPDEFEALVRATRAPDSERARIIAETRDEIRSKLFSRTVWTGWGGRHANQPQFIEERFALFGFRWKEFKFSEIPLPFLLEATDPELLEHARLSDPWHASLEALKKLQGRAASEEHDPWKNELFPLVGALRGNGTVDRDSAADGALLVDFVKAFGMLNLEKMARIYFLLRRGPSSSLSEEDRQTIADVIGPKLARLESPHVIHELRKLRFELQRDLLLDKVSRRLGSELGAEVFHALRGTTAWDRGDGIGALLETWSSTVSNAKAEAVRLEQKALKALTDGDEAEAERLYGLADAKRESVAAGKGYEEATFAVPRVYRSKDGSAGAEEEIGRLLERSDVGKDAKRLSPLGDALFILSEAGEKIRVRAVQNQVPEKPFDEREHVERMEADVRKAHGDPGELRRLTFEHLARIMPPQWLKHLTQDAFENTEDELRHRAEFLGQYLFEHYLNTAQDPSHTGHAPFSEPLRRRIGEALGVNGPSGENVILATLAGVDAIRAKMTRLSTDTVDVTLVPVQGAGRIFAGDIGDACYSSQHDALAGGEYPGVRALLFVTNRNKPTERLAGSVLFVETRTAQGERVLVVRANNPRENLIAQLDAASLAQQTVGAAIGTARRRNFKHVAVVRDNATEASSNRHAVSKFYASEWGDRKPVALVNEPETNFNGYDIWNDKGDHPSVIVWTNEDPKAT